MTGYQIEICANSAESAFLAQLGGADRVELCAGMPEGGTTPSIGEIRAARKLLDKSVLHVIIRPRGGDFLYSDLEAAIMCEDIRSAREAGADGVVLGCLTPEGSVDVDRMRVFMEAAEGMNVTFHRAFDMCVDPKQALEQLVSLGCGRILTSGQESSAEKGIPVLADLVRQAGGRIIVMPGCGIRESNIAGIARDTGATEFHLSGRGKVESGMVFRNARVSMGGTVCIDEYHRDRTDPAIVASVRLVLDALKVSG